MDARLQPVAVDVQPLAIARSALLTIGEAALEQTLCCLHVGATSTIIIMVRKGLPNFVRFLPTAGDTFTTAVRQAGIADATMAERVKRAFADLGLLVGYEAGGEESVFEVSGASSQEVAPPADEEVTQLDVEAPPEALELPEEETPPPPPSAAPAPARSPQEQQLAEQLAAALEQPAFDLANEVRRSIEFYRRQHRNEPVDRVVVSGGSALLGGLLTFLEGELGIGCQFSDPFANMVLPGDENLAKYVHAVAPVLAVAAGLALRDMIEAPLAARRP
jgi:type IV pilus assembly protein PilM